MKPIMVSAVALATALSACSYTETRTVQPVPRTAAVVTSTPPVTATTYTTPETTTTVYSR